MGDYNGSIITTIDSELTLRGEKTRNDEPIDSYGKLTDGYGQEFAVPDYTMKQLREAIPSHCWKRSAVTGSLYLARDVACMAATFWVFHTFAREEYVPSWTLRFALWTLYTFLQGLFGIGVWVVAHECNHGAFSEYPLLNDVVGWTFHSLLLVPYFSWKLSHKQHHSIHNNLAKDLQFVPKSRTEYGKHTGKDSHPAWEFTEETPIQTAIELIAQQLIGWPRHLLTHDSGSDGWKLRKDGRQINKEAGLGGGVNHFNPESPLFNESEGHLILLSDLGLLLTISLTAYIGHNFGWINIMVWYYIPYLWVNHWLVAIAYLQHTDPSLPKYQSEAWSYLRGAAATIDREFGFIGRHLFHEIIETHVLHHTFPTVPFYHAGEATDAIKRVMGTHYRSDTKEGPIGFLKSLWRCARWCQWVEESEGAQGEGRAIWFFRNSNGLGTTPVRR